jgi:lipopolysaccharide export system protein LptA
MTTRQITLSAMILSISLVAMAATRQSKPPAQPEQGKSASAAAKPDEKQKQRDIVIQVASFIHSDSDGNGEGRNVVVVDGETTVRADTGKWNTESRVAVATGNLSMTDPEADGTSEKAEVYYAKSKKLLIMTGKVTITVKPKKKTDVPAPKAPARPAAVVLKDGKATVQPDSQAEDDKEKEAPRRYPAVITCDRAEYQYDKKKKLGLLTGHFIVVQKLPDKTRTLTAERAEWYGLEERIVLHPPVHFEDTKGNSGDSKDVMVVYTKEGDDRVEGKATVIHFKVEADEEDEPKPAKKPEK